MAHGDSPRDPTPDNDHRPMTINELLECRTALTPRQARALRQHFATLIRTHHKSAWARLQRRGFSRADAEDILQDAFTEMSQRILGHGFEHSVGTLLNSALQNQLANHIAKKRRCPESIGLPSSSAERPRSSGPNAERDLGTYELAQCFFDRLPPDQQDVVDAVILKGMSQKEAADALGIPEGTLKSRLKAAKEALIALRDLLLPPSQQGGLR